jgi:hypothetical protein
MLCALEEPATMPKQAGVCLAILLAAAPSLAKQAGAPAPAAGDAPGREVTVNGCLLGKGYGGFIVADAKHGPAAPAATPPAPDADVKAAAAFPSTWQIDQPGNLRPYLGKHVQVTGRSEWEPPAPGSDAAGEAAPTPRVTLDTIRTVAEECPKPAR